MVFSGAKGVKWGEFNFYRWCTNHLNYTQHTRTNLGVRRNQVHHLSLNILAAMLLKETETAPFSELPADVVRKHLVQPCLTQIAQDLPPKRPVNPHFGNALNTLDRWRP